MTHHEGRTCVHVGLSTSSAVEEVVENDVHTIHTCMHRKTHIYMHINTDTHIYIYVYI